VKRPMLLAIALTLTGCVAAVTTPALYHPDPIWIAPPPPVIWLDPGPPPLIPWRSILREWRDYYNFQLWWWDRTHIYGYGAHHHHR